MVDVAELRTTARDVADERGSPGRWSVVPEDEMVDDNSVTSILGDEILVQWRSPPVGDGRIYLTLSARLPDDDGEEPESVDDYGFTSGAGSVGDMDLRFSGGGPLTSASDVTLEEAIEAHIGWMDSRPAVTSPPAFDGRISVGTIKPMVDAMRRLAGGKMLVRVDENAVEFQSRGLHQVTLELSADQFEQFTVTAAGMAVADVDDLWEVLNRKKFGDNVDIGAGAMDRKWQFGARSPRMKHVASVTHTVFDMASGSAQFLVDGQRFEEVIRAADLINGDSTAAVGVVDSDAFMEVQVDDGQAFLGDWKETSPLGEAVTATQLSNLREVQKSVARPSKTRVTFNVEDRGLLKLFYDQSEAEEGATVDISLRPSGLDELDEEYNLIPPSQRDSPSERTETPAESTGGGEGEEAENTETVRVFFEPPSVGDSIQDRPSVMTEPEVQSRGVAADERDPYRAMITAVFDPFTDEQLQRFADADGTVELGVATFRGGSVFSGDVLNRPEKFIEMDFADDPAALVPGDEPTVQSEETAVQEGQYDVQVVVDDPTGGFENTYRVEEFRSDLRKNPDVPLTDDAVSSLTSSARDKFDGWMFREGDVVAFGGVKKAAPNAQEDVRVTLFDTQPGIDLLEERNTAGGDGTTPDVTFDDGWQGLPPRAVLNLEPGDMVGSFVFAPVQEIRNIGVVVGWDNGRKYVIQPQARSALWLRWDEDTEQPTDEPIVSPASVAVLKQPTDDDILGWVPGSDTGATPWEPFMASEIPDSFEIDPFFRSEDGLNETIGRRAFVRRPGGEVMDTEIAGEDPRHACVTVPDRVSVEGKICVPSSSEDSELEMVAVQPAEAQEIEVNIQNRTTGFDAGGLASSYRLTLSPLIEDDPNDVAREIRNALTDTFGGAGIARFKGIDGPLATATVRGGKLEEGEFGVEELNEPESVEEIDFHRKPPQSDDKPVTAERIRAAFPAFNTPQAEEIAEFVESVEGVLQFTPNALMEIDGVADGTVANIEGVGEGFRPNVTIGEQGAEMAGAEESDTPGDTVTVVSRNRPLPLGAQQDLEQFGVVEERSPREPMRMDVVELEERPPDNVLDRWDLTLETEPIEIWTDGEQEVRIFPDKVVAEDDGELGMDPEEAAREAREQDRFEPVDVPDDNPFGDVEPVSFDMDDLPEKLREVELFSDSEASVALVQQMFPTLSDAQAREVIRPYSGFTLEDGLLQAGIGTLLDSVPGVGKTTVEEMLGVDDLDTSVTGSGVLIENLERDITESVTDEVLDAAADVDIRVVRNIRVEESEEGPRYTVEGSGIPTDLRETVIGRTINEFGPVEETGWQVGDVVGTVEYNREFETVGGYDYNREPPELGVDDGGGDGDDSEEPFTGDIVVAADPATNGYITNPEQDEHSVVREFVSDVRDEFGAAETVIRQFPAGDPDSPRAVAFAVVEDDEFVEKDFSGGEAILAGKVQVLEPELTPNQLSTAVRKATDGVRVSTKEAFGQVVGVTMSADGSVRMDREEISVGGAADTRQLVRLAVGKWAVAANAADVDARAVNEGREEVNDEFSMDLPLIDTDDLPEEDAPKEADESGESDDERTFTRGEYETIVEQATAGVSAQAQVLPGDDVPSEIRMEDDGSGVFTRDTATARPDGDTPQAAIDRALEQWREFADLTAVDGESINERRDALSEQFGISLPEFDAPEEEATEPAEKQEEQPMTDRENISQDLFTELVETMEEHGFPATDPPADFFIEDDVIVANPVVGSEWDGVLERKPPQFRQDPDQSRREFMSDYLQALVGFMEPDRAKGVDAESIPDSFGVKPPDRRRETTDESTTTEQDTQRDDEFLTKFDEPWREIVSIAITQDRPSEEREAEMGTVMEESGLFEQGNAVSGVFTEAFVDLQFPRGGVGGGREFAEQVGVELGGLLPVSPNNDLSLPDSVSVVTASGQLINIDAVWQNFVEVMEMLRPDSDTYPEISSKLETIDSITAFKIQEDRVDWEDAFLDVPEIAEIAGRSVEVWTSGILEGMRGVSKAWWAAQRVKEAIENPDVREQLEREISKNVSRGGRNWYLKNAWEIWLDEDEFDPVKFTKEWHKVFTPGESKDQAEMRRGEVDLETLGRPGVTPEPTPEPETEPAPEPEVDTGEETGTEEPSVDELADNIRDRM